ncbi:cytochrome c oxidase assembly protein COX16 homolog, mitochondrial isoform X1 [Pseudopipra pipra]|uniref:cytochrome c oxidase assembly protein COX16 homolog, mitochondrial isoform X1 n=1 Tax=Pseudopipra pipra TaxID=415032 RepID=UPI003139B2E2
MIGTAAAAECLNEVQHPPKKGIHLRVTEQDYALLLAGTFVLLSSCKPAQVDPALKEKLKQNTVTLESEYEKLEKSDLNNWENIRGPSLWEDSRTVQKQRREALHLKQSD